jgi:hypothetical protein
MTDPPSRQRGRPPQEDKDSNSLHAKLKIWSWAPEGARHQDRLADWPSAVTWLWLWLWPCHFSPWRWRQHVSLKHQHRLANTHGAKTQDLYNNRFLFITLGFFPLNTEVTWMSPRCVLHYYLTYCVYPNFLCACIFKHRNICDSVQTLNISKNSLQVTDHLPNHHHDLNNLPSSVLPLPTSGLMSLLASNVLLC